MVSPGTTKLAKVPLATSDNGAAEQREQFDRTGPLVQLRELIPASPVSPDNVLHTAWPSAGSFADAAPSGSGAMVGRLAKRKRDIMHCEKYDLSQESNTIRNYLTVCGGTPFTPEEAKRFQILQEACADGDLGFLLLHRVLALWASGPGRGNHQKAVNYFRDTNVTKQVLDNVLGALVKALPLHDMTKMRMDWFSLFPLRHDFEHQIPRLVGPFVEAVNKWWPSYRDEGIAKRGYPLLASDMVCQFRCTSRLCQEALATLSREILLDGIEATSQVRARAEDIWRRDQDRYVENGGCVTDSEAIDELMASDASFISEYRRLFDEVGRGRNTDRILTPCLPLEAARQPSPNFSVSQPTAPSGRAETANAGISRLQTTNSFCMRLQPPPSLHLQSIPNQSFTAVSQQMLASNFPPAPDVSPQPTQRAGGWPHHVYPQQSQIPRMYPMPQASQAQQVPQWPQQTVMTHGVPQYIYSPAQHQQHTQYVSPPPIQQQRSSHEPWLAQQRIFDPRQQQRWARRHAQQVNQAFRTSQQQGLPTQTLRPATGMGHHPSFPLLPQVAQSATPTRIHAGFIQNQLMSAATPTPSMDQYQPCRVNRFRGSGTTSTERYYESIVSLALSPTLVPPTNTLHRLEFEIKEDQMALLSRIKRADDSLDEWLDFFNRSLRYRLRCCLLPNKTEAEPLTPVDSPTEQDWSRTKCSWPIHVFGLLNGKPLSIIKASHPPRGPPVELTGLLRCGKNVLDIGVPASEENLKTAQKGHFFVAVEILETVKHSDVVEMIWQHVIPQEQTRRQLEQMLTGDDDIGVQTISIDLKDPFSSSLWVVPARGAYCTHLQCFDLDIWLGSREPTNARRKCLHSAHVRCQCPEKTPDEPSHPDKWMCPICGKDARPKSLRLDGYFLDVRKQLEREGKTRAERILFEKANQWRVILDLDDADGQSEIDKPRVLGDVAAPGVNRMAIEPPVSVSRRQTTSIVPEGVEIIELD